MVDLRKPLTLLCTFIAVIFCLFQIYATAGFGSLEAPILRSWHLAFVLVLIFLWNPLFKGKSGSAWLLFDIALAIAAISIAYFVFNDLESILSRIPYVDEVSNIEIFFGTLLILLTLEGTRRVSGWPLVIVSGIAILYAMLGQHLPAFIRHDGISYQRFIEQMFLLTDGIYGIPLAVASTMIFAFAMFGAFLETSTMNSVFIDLSCLLTKNSKGGPAKVAIFASALFGSVSGSAPANVYATGIFTIPLMKRVGYRPAFAGAVEATASTGGQIMPPVMGAGAFIMADLTGKGYLSVLQAALLPALLYYLALWLMIHFEAVKHNLGTIPKEDIPEKSAVIRKLYYLLPLAVLIGALVSGRSVNFAAFSSTAFIVILGMLATATRFTPARLIQAFVMSARNALNISVCSACAGIVVGVIIQTGLGFKFINVVTAMAGNNLMMMMILLMITCLVVGMGVPTTPAYIIAATLGAPVLMKMGVPVMAAHMFVFYFAIISAITPPVCMAAFSGAAIAEANAMKTGFIACRLGIVAFIIPFIFVLQPELLWQGALIAVIPASITAIIGVVSLSAAMQKFMLIDTTLVERLMLFVGGLGLLYPGLRSDLIGAALLAAVLAMQIARKKRLALA